MSTETLVCVDPRLGTVIYTVPRINAHFSSPMHRMENLCLDGEDVVRAVAAGLKPMGELVADNPERVISQVPYGVQWAPEEDPRLVVVSMSGCIGESFDLPDYYRWLAFAPHLRSAVRAEIDRLSTLHFSALADMRLIDAGYITPASLVRSGLLLGYPPAITISWILMDAGVPGCGNNFEDLKCQ